ncbi:MAG: protein kinase [Planctomycetales bacterium]|nr:protein kinase [Planctomycetales bacterium]
MKPPFPSEFSDNGNANIPYAETLTDQAWARVASWVLSSLEPGKRTNARAVLEQHPVLASNHNAVVRLALEEFSQAVEAGESPEIESYVQRFPEVGPRLREDLELLMVLRESDDSLFLTHEQPVASWPECPCRFGPFQLESPLGGGPESRVFRAVHAKSGEARIIKVTRAAGPEIAVRAAVRSPRIVPIEGPFRDPRWSLVGLPMPILGRATLQDFYERAWREHRLPESIEGLEEQADAVARAEGFERAPLAFSEFLLIALLQVARALSVLHRGGYMHGDVKPANLLIGDDGLIRIFDFDLTHALEGEFQRWGGTPQFTAPEHLARLSAEPESRRLAQVDTRMDVFSFGATAYLLITGRFPFGWVRTDLSRAEATCTLLERQRMGARPISDLNPDLDPAIGELVHACLAFRPTDRPDSMQRIVDELESRLTPRQLQRRSWTRWTRQWWSRLTGQRRPSRNSV